MSYTIVIGEQRFSLALNNEQLDGIISAWLDLFTKARDEELMIYLPNGIIHPLFKDLEDTTPYNPFNNDPVDHSNDWIDTHLLMHEREFFEDRDYPYSFVCPEKTWYECLKSLIEPHNPGKTKSECIEYINNPSNISTETWHECLRYITELSNISIKRFTFVALERPIHGPMQSPMIVNQEVQVNEFFIRHCDTLEYIQGYIALCNWTKTPWQDHIKLVHDGNTPFPLTSW